MTYDISDLARPTIKHVSPYIPGASLETISREYNIPRNRIVKLGSNENSFGTSPKAIKAAQRAAAQCHRYPDNYALLEAISKHHNVLPEQIVLGNGSTEVIDMIARVFLDSDTEAVSSQYGFGMFATMTKLAGAKNVIVPAKNFGHDLEAMLSGVNDSTRVVWIANPNNPTGSFMTYEDIKIFVRKVPKYVVVVIDEAYYDYLDRDLRQDATKWLAEHPNLILLRTFSKIYGLAGLRIGYGIMDSRIANLLNRAKQPLNINSAGLAASIAALQDQSFVNDSYQRNREGLLQLETGLKELGIMYLPTHGNFITIEVTDAKRTNNALLAAGIIVRPLDTYGMPNHLRATIGTSAENKRLLNCLAKS